MFLALYLLALVASARGAGLSPDPTGPTDPQESSPDSYELFDNKTTTLADRRALDLTPPMSKNGAAGTDDLVKRFGNNYFLNEEHNLTAPAVTNPLPGVIQRVGKSMTTTTPTSEEEEETLNVPVVRPISGVEWLLDVYNPHHWQPEFLPGLRKLSDGCQRDLQVYLRALRNGTIWAAKSKYHYHRVSFNNNFLPWLVCNVFRYS